MKLNQQALSLPGWKEAGFALPEYDIAAVAAATAKAPAWVHFGAGNIFRAFPAALQQSLLNRGVSGTGIIVAEGYDYEIIDSIFVPHDNLSLLVTLKADGSTEKTVIASITEALKADSSNDKHFARLKEVFRAPSLQMASFTITEKGYSLSAPGVSEDMKAGPDKPASYIGKLTALMYERYLAGRYPIAMVSMDNCSHNGDKLRDAVCAFGHVWSRDGLAEPGFAEYLNDSGRVSFPWSMIDKITPRPDDTVKQILSGAGFEDVEGVTTSKNTYIAPFVNAEETQWLVIEDQFPAGRPPLEDAGVIFTGRETVDKVEKMKVCTCLNPLHTALALFGCLLGYTRISEEMKDADLVHLVERIGYTEGLPVVVNPGILDPKAFIDNVLQVRLPNPFMPDTPQRIACDTSQKLPIRFGETIKAYAASSSLSVQALEAIPLALAGWLRYLMAVDDEGNPFELSPDPKLDELTSRLEGMELGGKVDGQKVRAILSDTGYFGVDLYQAGLGERVEAYLAELIVGPGAVRRTLEKLRTPDR